MGVMREANNKKWHVLQFFFLSKVASFKTSCAELAFFKFYLDSWAIFFQNIGLQITIYLMSPKACSKMDAKILKKKNLTNQR